MSQTTSKSPLTARQQDILQAIINTHITTAEAVGSRTVAKKMGFKLSPASIRNVMADLEEMGYVSQPHVSAGRIPTETGYRFYVNALMETENLETEQRQMIEDLYGARIKQIEELLELSSRLLSMLTRYTAVVQTPVMDVETIKRLELVPISSGKVVVVLVTSLGDVRKQVVALPEISKEYQTEELARFLNDKLCSLSFRRARSMLDSLRDSPEPGDETLAELAGKILDGILDEKDAREVYLDGMENIFDQPEFRDFAHLRRVLRVLEEKRRLNELLEFCMSEDSITEVSFRIGSENPMSDAKGCSVVVSPYKIAGATRGAVGVIGPTRMQYSRASTLVSHVAHRLGSVLTEMTGVY